MIQKRWFESITCNIWRMLVILFFKSWMNFNVIANLYLNFYDIFDMDILSWLSLESYLLLWICVLWVTVGLIKTAGLSSIDIIYVNSSIKYVIFFVLVGALFLIVHRLCLLDSNVYLLNDMWVLDSWIIYGQLGILVLTLVFFVLTSAYNFTRNSYYYEMLLFGMTVMILMTWLLSAHNFIIFYLILEGTSLIFYTIATRTFVYGGVESGLKYYSLGALASVLLLIGILCVFIIVGSLDFLVISLAVKAITVFSFNGLLLALGLVLILMIVFFKLSAFPGHVWTPDVYQGTTLETLWVFAVLIKFIVFILFLRFFALFYLTPGMELSTNFWIITSCLGSLLIGAAGAFLITNLKRFVAYTAINQMGFLFIGLSTLSVDGLKATVNYLIIYVLINLLFFCVITMLQFKKQLVGETILRSLKDLTVIKKAPFEMGLLIVALLSMGGLPPLAGFAGKYVLWISLLSQYFQTNVVGLSENLIYILIISVVLSLLSTFYYLRFIKLILFDNFESGNVPIVELRSSSSISVLHFVVGLLGLITVGWFFALSYLDTFWTNLTLYLLAPVGL